MPSHSTPATTRGRRVALLVAGIWFITAIPVVLGVSSCPVARYLHAPCPGCGMTRAIDLLFHGDVAASLAMHPLAVPTLLVSFRDGSPFGLWKSRMGRLSVYAAALVLGLDLVLWLARFGGLMHGPVPV